MKFSIITPSYNGAKYLRECLESVQKQRGVELEHIVTDACSTDETLKILSDFQSNVESQKLNGELDGYTFEYHSEPDKGMSDGINKGLRKATGDWWMWLNTDDYLEEGALLEVQQFIEAHSDADVVYGGWHFVDVDGKIFRSPDALPYSRRMVIYHGCYFGSTATFYKKASTIDRGEFVHERFKQAMDQEYYARLGALKLKFVPMPKVRVASFRVHDENTSMRYSGEKDIDSVLNRQLQLAESVAVRRKYGATPFKHELINGAFDCAAHFFYRGLKLSFEAFHFFVHRVFCKVNPDI
jgi:glycosyltransferase involved in cell wall biosynthesis